MMHPTDPRDKKDQSTSGSTQQTSGTERSPEEIRQEQTDPNLTELKGFIDPNEKLEPEGTDNDFSDTI